MQLLLMDLEPIYYYRKPHNTWAFIGGHIRLLHTARSLWFPYWAHYWVSVTWTPNSFQTWPLDCSHPSYTRWSWIATLHGNHIPVKTITVVLQCTLVCCGFRFVLRISVVFQQLFKLEFYLLLSEPYKYWPMYIAPWSKFFLAKILSMHACIIKAQPACLTSDIKKLMPPLMFQATFVSNYTFSLFASNSCWQHTNMQHPIICEATLLSVIKEVLYNR